MIPQIQRLTSWAQLTLADMAFAYRKAKSDCFFERSILVNQSFAAYEENLVSNLSRLLARLRSNDRSSIVRDERMLGERFLLPKSLSIEPQATTRRAYFSNPDRAIDQLRTHATASAEFRITSRFPVEAYVLSALWVNRIGHRFDAYLHDVSLGTRVRRYGCDREQVGVYHIKSVGTFGSYVQPYRKWREGGLVAAQGALERGEKIVAVTTDFKNYYHNIDPGFIREDDFRAALRMKSNAESEDCDPRAGLSEAEEELTSMLVEWLKRWSNWTAALVDSTTEGDKSHRVGLPIGLTAAQIIANVLLAPLDRAVVEHLTPIYYGRYVDDIFLVLHDGGVVRDPAGVMRLVADRLPKDMLLDQHQTGQWAVRIEGQGRSKLELHEEKSRVFFLEGRTGLDLLSIIRREVADLSSERRLMPDPKTLTDSVASRALTAMGDSREATDVLRKAEGLSIKRMGWAIQLSAAEALAADLPAVEWHQTRRGFYRFARDHVLRPDVILDHLSYFPRLLGLAIYCRDWQEATSLIQTAEVALRWFSNLTWSAGLKLNGREMGSNGQTIWEMVSTEFKHLARDAVLRAWPFVDRQPEPEPVVPISGEMLEYVGLTESRLLEEAVRLRETDLACVPLKEHRKDHGVCEWTVPDVDHEMAKLLWPRVDDLREFLTSTVAKRVPNGSKGSESLVPFMFPTRPYSTRDIAEFEPRCHLPADPGQGDLGVKLWGRWARAVRGVWTCEVPDSEAASTISRDSVRVLTFGGRHQRRAPKVCLANLEVAETCWHAAAGGVPDLSCDRYQRLVALVNSVLSMSPRPHYLLLPELSVPRRWVDSLANKLLASKISLIAGVEYGHTKPDLVTNEVVLALIDDRLGCTSNVMYWQKKTAPAPAEEEELENAHGRRWKASSSNVSNVPVTVYRHFGFEFGLLLCSELQDITFRQQYQGQVDALFVLSWNKDLETFGSLIEAAALDVHAYVGLVNNRLFGDSRLRVPAKEHHLRDQCRLHGGLNDFAAVVELDIGELRRFQSRAKNRPREDDPFKPVPQGFKIAVRRHENPGVPRGNPTKD